MADLLMATDGQPGCRTLRGLRTVTLRHGGADALAAQGVHALGLPWPLPPCTLAGVGPWLAWCGPHESLLLSHTPQPAAQFLQALAPGKSATAFAVDVSEAHAVYELHGPQLECWLSRLVDADAIPADAGRCSRARMADVAVLLLRLSAERLWLLADSPVCAYLENWLVYAHEGAFGRTPAND